MKQMKYYDEQCRQCPDCYYYQDGKYSDGKAYMACRYYGYILHPEKGISEEECNGFKTEAQYKREQEQQKKNDERRRKRSR